MTDAGAVAESLLEQGITGMKIWPFDPAAIENEGRFITAEQMRKAVEPFEKIRKAVGDRMQIMVEMHSPLEPAEREEDRPRARGLRRRPGTRTRSG